MSSLLINQYEPHHRRTNECLSLEISAMSFMSSFQPWMKLQKGVELWHVNIFSTHCTSPGTSQRLLAAIVHIDSQ
jgi:hypothetical protein